MSKDQSDVVSDDVSDETLADIEAKRIALVRREAYPLFLELAKVNATLANLGHDPRGAEQAFARYAEVQLDLREVLAADHKAAQETRRTLLERANAAFSAVEIVERLAAADTLAGVRAAQAEAKRWLETFRTVQATWFAERDAEESAPR